MADDSDDRERTESPTQKRLDDARSKGQVPRSRDLSAAAVVLAGGLGLLALGSVMGGQLLSIMRDGLTLSSAEVFDNGRMLLRFGHAAMQGGLAIAPLLGLLLAAALLAPLAIGGWTFSSEALVPNFERLNPIDGLGRIFSVRGLIELGKALARFAGGGAGGRRASCGSNSTAIPASAASRFKQPSLTPSGSAAPH